MPFPRHLKASTSRIAFHCPCRRYTNFILPYHEHTTSIYTRYRCRHRYGYGHGYGYGHTRKARFSTTHSRYYAASREPTLYEILDVPVTASQSEIKKKFYSLSLIHHPDRNRSDPSASSRFSNISSAYQILNNAAKRASYDRETGIHATSASTHSTASPGQNPMGSHSSHASYYGSRPASGLSKRRGTFRGPPPSFYAHGGYGNRRAPSGSESSSSVGGRGGMGSSSGAAGGAGSDDDPTSFIDRNRLSYFNARGHYRTQTAEDVRRQQRRARQSREDINEQFLGSRGDHIVRFVAVFSILVSAGTLTGLFRWPSNTEKPTRSSSTKG
ncbi:DnaJ domain-containing protein [Aspergillus californicus]